MSTPSMDPVFLGYPAFPIKNAGVISSSVFARGSFVGIKTKTLSTKILPSPHPQKKEKKKIKIDGTKISHLCACLETWIRKLLWSRRSTGTIETDTPLCSSLEECSHIQCEEHSSIRRNGHGHVSIFRAESAFCSKYINNMQVPENITFPAFVICT